MKKPSESLFLLIKSLTKSEKRYFKLFAGLYSGKNDTSYVTLFDLIDKQANYDEEKLKERLKGTMLGKNLPVSKNYLQKLILKSLYQYGTGEDQYDESLKHFIYSRILFKKGLYQQSRDYIKRARKTSIKHQKFVLGVDIKKYERFQDAWGRRYFNEKNINETFDELFNLLEKERVLLEQLRFSDIVFMFVNKKQQARRQSEVDEITASFEKHMKPIPKEYESPLALKFYHQSRSLYYSYIGDYKNQFEEIKNSYKVFGAEISSVTERVSLLINYFGAAQANGKFDDCKKVMKELEEMEYESGYSEHFKLSLTYLLKLGIYIQTREFQKAGEHIKKHQEAIMDLNYGQYFYYLQLSTYMSAYYHFIKGNYQEGLMWLNKFFFFQNEKKDFKEEIYFKASVLYILIHYELNNEDLLKYFIKQTYKWLQKRGGVDEYEASVLDFLKKNLTSPNAESVLADKLKAFKPKLVKLAANPLNRPVVDFLDLVAWAENKIDRKPLEKVLIDKGMST